MLCLWLLLKQFSHEFQCKGRLEINIPRSVSIGSRPWKLFCSVAIVDILLCIEDAMKVGLRKGGQSLLWRFHSHPIYLDLFCA
jgi:hypothetical protein